MILGRRWAKIGMWAIAVVMTMGMGQSARAEVEYVFHPAGTDPLASENLITESDFGPVVKEQTSVANLAVSLVGYFTGFGPPDTNAMKFVFEDARNRLVFNSAINVEFSGDTVSIPLLFDPEGSVIGVFYDYFPTTAPFTVSFRPNERGRFVDTLTFIFTYPVLDTVKLEVSGDGIGFLRFIDPTSGQPKNTISMTFAPTRVGDSLPGSGFPVGVINTSAIQLGKISDIITSDPNIFHIVNPQLEVQPNALGILSVQYTPRALGIETGWAKVISDDFGVDTAFMILQGSGLTGYDYFTMDDTLLVGDAEPSHLLIDDLVMRTTLFNELRFDSLALDSVLDTLIWIQNRLNHNVAFELVMNDGSDFELLAQFGVGELSRNHRDSLFTDDFITDSVVFRDSVYGVGDTIRVGFEVIEVQPVFTIVPVVLTRTLALNDSTRVWVRLRPNQRGTFRDIILTSFKAFIGDTVTWVTAEFPVRGTIIGPSFEADRDSIDFGPLTPGLTLRDSLLLTNDSGQVPVDVVIDTSGLDPVFTLLTEPSFSYSQTQQFYVLFEYAAVDALFHQDTVLFTSSDPNNPLLQLILTGGTQAPVILSSPTSLSFGDVVVGDSASKTVTIKNIGLVTLNVSGITNSQGVFTATPSAFAVAPGGSQAVTVQLKPVAAVAYTDTLKIASDDPATPVYMVPLSGGGSDPQYAGDMLLTFGATTLNAGSLIDSVSICNTGTRGNMEVRVAISNGASFSLARETDTLIFVAAGTCRSIAVRFTQTLPAVTGDSLVLTTNDPATPLVYIELSGGGFFRQLDWLSGPLKDTTLYQYGKVSLLVAETLTSVMTNLGNDTLHVTSVSLYSGAEGFARVTPSLGGLLQSEQFDVTLVFTPTSAGIFSDTMLITTDDTTSGNDSIIVPLEALVFMPGLQALAGALAFDTTIIGQTRLDSVGFSNPGEASVTIASVTLVNGSRFALAGFPGNVAGDDTGFVKVIFAPLDTITYHDTLVVTTSNPANTLWVPISGSGAGGRYQDDVTSIHFTPVPVFVTGQESFTIQNVGNQPLEIISIEAKDTTSSIFARLSPATLILGAGEQATITIGFTPTASAAYVDTIVITTNDASNASVLIPLFGETPDQDINFGPDRLVKITNPSIDWGGTPVGGFSEIDFVIYNVGLDTLHIITGSLVLDDTVDTVFTFFASQLQNKFIPPGGSLSSQVVHRPVEKSVDSAYLVIVSNDPDQDTVVLRIYAHGVSGQLSRRAGDSTFTLGTVKVGTVDTSGEVSIQNKLGPGNRVRLTEANFLVPPYPDITIQAGIYRFPEPFTFFDFDPGNLPTIGGDSIITFRMIYAPTDTGTITDIFRIIGTPDNAGDTITIPFQARGGAASISLSRSFFDFGITSVGPVASVAINFDITNSGADTLVVDTLLTTNAGAGHYNDAYVGAGFLPFPWIIPPGVTVTQQLVVKVMERRVYYDTLAFVNNDFFNDPFFVQTRVVGIAPGDTGFVDTLRISDYETESGNVIIPLHLAFDEPIKRFTIPLVYTSKVFECIALDFAGTLLENVDGLLPEIDTVANTIVIKGNAIFGQPVVPDGFIGTVFAKMIFRASPGVAVGDSSITFDTLFIPPDLRYSLQDTALQVILPEFVAGRLDIVTDIDEHGLLPREFELSQNFPNPFNPSTTISYSVPRASYVSLVVYNLLGQRIATLVDAVIPPGRYETEWNGRDENGVSVSSGIYFYHLGAGDYSETLKMVLMK